MHCSSEPSSTGFQVRFESAEHEAIGNKVTLQYDSSTVQGKDFGYVVKKNTLSFGLIVALAGDFYANWTVLPGDVEQISDKWDTDRKSSISRGIKNANSLSTDKDNYLTSLLSTMDSQENDVFNGMKSGKDVAQIYASIADAYDKKYFWDTNSGYGWIALCNWDHFGEDAVKAYSAVHTAALNKAKEAFDGDATQVDPTMKDAYFLEAFAQHFLTDLFSTGHLRAPRRILHHNVFGDPEDPDDPHSPNIELYPADRCAQKMHDEDCANGLWVTNALGESWAAYGDKQMFSGKSSRNYLQAVKAAQTGVNEIWITRKSGIIPPPSEFKALKMVPLSTHMDPQTNFVPLFRWDSATPKSLFMRSELDKRNDSSVIVLSSKESFSTWMSLVDKIYASGENTNMYPFTQSFISPTNVWHIRETADQNMVLNHYGVVDSGAYGACWCMDSQLLIPVSRVAGPMMWVTATVLVEFGVWSLVGRFNPPNSKSISTYHLGINISKDNTSASIAWSTTTPDDNVGWKEGDVAYGCFSEDTDDVGMIKYWTNGPGSREVSKLELWIISSPLDSPPIKKGPEWKITPLNFMLPFQVAPEDSFQTFIGCGFSSNLSATMWYFSTWTEGYSNQLVTTYKEAVEYPTQVLFSGKFGSENCLFRLFYGPTFPSTDTLLIEVLQPSRDPTSRQISLRTLFRQKFFISWSAYFPKDYLTWFLADVNGNNHLDLVALAVNPRLGLRVIVIPGGSTTFDTPIVSEITLDPSKGTLFNAPFMTPISASQASFSYPDKVVSSAGILAFFDNYGILGARILAPVASKGTYQYEFKGQLPAIAGQSSKSLGMTDADWMGRGERPQGIGFAFD